MAVKNVIVQVVGIDKIVSRSFMKKLISSSGLALVKGGAVSGAKIRRALRNNDKKISLDNNRTQLNGDKECQKSNNTNCIRRKQEPSA